MAMCPVKSIGLIVILFVSGTIVATQYVSENDLMSDPTKCRATEELEFKLDDIARHYNGITELTVFGQGLLNLDKWFLLKLIPKNDYGASYSISITAEETQIRSNSDWLYSWTTYREMPLNLSEFAKIDIQLKFGDEFRITVLLPNGVEIKAYDKAPKSIETVSLSSYANWYYNCHISNEYTLYPDARPETFQSIGNTETNSIVAQFWTQSKAKINNFIGSFNITLS